VIHQVIQVNTPMESKTCSFFFSICANESKTCSTLGFFLQDVGVIKIYMYACRVGKTRKPKKLNQMQ
jgi:hypothetical protein